MGEWLLNGIEREKEKEFSYKNKTTDRNCSISFIRCSLIHDHHPSQALVLLSCASRISISMSSTLLFSLSSPPFTLVPQCFRLLSCPSLRLPDSVG